MPDSDKYTKSENMNEAGRTEPQSPIPSPAPPLVEAALACLVTAARIAGTPADLEGILRAFPSRKTEEIVLILLRAAKKLGLKAKHITTSIDRLDKLPSPSLLLFPDGETVICLRAETAPPEHESDEESVKKAALKGRVVLFHPRGKKPFIWSFEQLAEKWEGDAIPLAKRFSFEDLSKKFGIGWFLPVILRFRKHLSEVFIGSFFLQICQRTSDKAGDLIL